MKKINLLQPGSIVWIKSNQPFPVEIQATHIFSKEMLVSYDVFWWDGYDRKQMTIGEDEVRVEKVQHMKVGFGENDSTIPG